MNNFFIFKYLFLKKTRKLSIEKKFKRLEN